MHKKRRCETMDLTNFRPPLDQQCKPNIEKNISDLFFGSTEKIYWENLHYISKDA